MLLFLLGYLFGFDVISFCLMTRLSFFLLCWSGGEDGAAGLNLLHRADGRVLNLGAKTSVSLQPGVRLQVYLSWHFTFQITVIIHWIFLLCCMNRYCILIKKISFQNMCYPTHNVQDYFCSY